MVTWGQPKLSYIISSIFLPLKILTPQEVAILRSRIRDIQVETPPFEVPMILRAMDVMAICGCFISVCLSSIGLYIGVL